MTEEFVLDIEGTGVVKHMTYNIVITWESDETQEKIEDVITAIKLKKTELKFDDEYKGPIIVLKNGIKEWMEATLENTVYGRCKSLEAGDTIGGPELIFGSEADRASFILRWL